MQINAKSLLTNHRSEHIYKVAELLEKFDNSTYKIGSMHVKVLYDDSKSRTQILLCNDIDGLEQPIKFHAHSVHEYFICLEGEFVILRDDKEIILSPNDYYHISPGVVHYTYPKAGCSILAIFVPSETNFNLLNVSLKVKDDEIARK